MAALQYRANVLKRPRTAQSSSNQCRPRPPDPIRPATLLPGSVPEGPVQARPAPGSNLPLHQREPLHRIMGAPANQEECRTRGPRPATSKPAQGCHQLHHSEGGASPDEQAMQLYGHPPPGRTRRAGATQISLGGPRPEETAKGPPQASLTSRSAPVGLQGSFPGTLESALQPTQPSRSPQAGQTLAEPAPRHAHIGSPAAESQQQATVPP
ncbi:hypothetical protein NDU88_007632 [Pleurodeles waltl]|uniref:Uncharacterized protein n=1 Tax=Pleurodeles waltl TaxID=8319 RepID=A0AAV7QLH4_PLEWA|nr:hypothetical protein NDU88_007632 [Pleurodeles waltl]